VKCGAMRGNRVTTMELGHYSTTTVVKESKLQEAIEGLKAEKFPSVRRAAKFLDVPETPYGIGIKAGERLEWRAMKSSNTLTKIRRRY